MSDFKQNLKHYILSGHAILNIPTYERGRCTKNITDLSKEIDRKILIWSAATGFRDEDFVPKNDTTDPVGALSWLAQSTDNENTIIILKDFAIYLNKDLFGGFDSVIAWLDELKTFMSNRCQTIIIVGPQAEIPDSMRREITDVDFPLPSREDIKNYIDFIIEGVESSDGSKFEPDKEYMEEIVMACRGMTEQETLDRLALALAKHHNFNEKSVKTISNEKANVIRSSGLLTWLEPLEGGLSVVGGYKALKNHIMLDKPCFSDEAKNFGVDPPKGILSAGIPGTGKSLLARAIASEFGIPAILLDIGSLMGSLVGESEANTRKAIKIIESVQPCLVILDEIEKSFGSRGDLDGGSSKRVLGTLLTWLNDRTSLCYIVATANDVSVLPPELIRSGRFDAVFGLGLPQPNERKEIYKIHINKRKRNPDNYNLDDLVKESDGFTGADIESAVKLAMKIAFSQKKDLDDNSLHIATKSITPISKIEPEKIEAITDWIKKRAKLANPPEREDKENKTTRKVTI